MMTTQARKRRRAALGAVIAVLASAAPALGQSAPVLAIVPEGAVIDGAELPNLAPGARVGFRRPDGGAAQVGEGFVLDVREGRALIGLKPGGSVQAGDLAVRCASLSSPGSQGDLRASVQSIKAQLAPAGGGSPELQAAIGQLESTLDTREAAIRDGACDVASHDQQIADLSLQLQQMLAASAGAASPGAVPAPPQPPPTTLPGTEPVQTPTVGAAPPPPAIGQPGTGTENIVVALQVAQQLLQMAQSAGLIRQPRQSGGQQPGMAIPSPDVQAPPPAQAMVPIDPGSGQALPPAAVEPPGSPSPTVGSPTEPASPPVAVGTDTPSQTGQPPGTRPPPGRPAAPEKPSPSVVTPPVRTPPPQWWAVTPPKQPAPVAGAMPGTAPSPPTSATLPGSTTGPGKVTPPERPSAAIVPGRVPTGSQAAPGGQTASVPPSVQRTAIVKGVVRADNGAPIAGAFVRVGGRQARTNAQGVFVVTGVPLGRQTLLATAGGFSEGKLAVELASGEVEVVALTLRRAPVPPLVQPPRPATPPSVAGPTARVSPTVQRVATVQGVVRADNGAPIPGALVTVGGKRVKTNAEGAFVVTDVPLGRQTLLVTAGGFSDGKLAIDLTSGEVEKVALTLRPATSSAPAQKPR
jgi:hypothetical protein